MSGHRHHQRSASTGSQRIMHDIGLTSSHLIHQMSSSSPEPFSEEDEDGENEDLDMKGTLSKWTNYIHGWQDRFFALKNGTFVYYKSQLESDFGCRGAISVDKASVKLHGLDDLRFDVSVNDCVWYLRASSVEDRQKWVDCLQSCNSIRRQHQDSFEINRHDSALSLSSTTSLRNLKDKVNEMETFKDILSQQIDTLGSYIEDLSRNSADQENKSKTAKPTDFKSEAITFKATANGILFSLTSCIDILAKSEEQWYKRIEKEQAARKRAEHKLSLLIKQQPEYEKREEPPPQPLASQKSQVLLMNGPDFEEGPNSQIAEDEFFDAVETALDKLQEEQEFRDKLKMIGELSLNESNAKALNHPLWNTIDETTNEQLHYARLQVGQDSVWELFAEDGEMKMYKREEEIDGMVVDPLKALHQVQGVTARELCHYFFAPEVRMEWETTLEQATVLEKISDETLVFLQLHKRVWPAAQRDALFWSHQRCVSSDDESQTWIVCNKSTKHPNAPENQGNCLRVDLTVCFVCDTTVAPPYNWQNASRKHLTTKITYCSVVNPGGWAPASVLRAVYKREYPRFLKRFTQYVDEKCNQKPILW